MKTIKIFGDIYKIRETFDIVDYVGDVNGYEVYNEDGRFILQYDCEELTDLIKFLKWRIYKIRWAYL